MTASTANSRNQAFDERLDSAKRGDEDSLGDLLQLYRNYLRVLASSNLDGKLRRRVGTSDLVQDAMLVAQRDFNQFRGESEGELLAWLRTVLGSCLSHAVEKHVFAKKRDVRREVALDQIGRNMDESVARISNLVADNGQTPSKIAQRRELAVALSDQLAKLKPRDRDVIVLRHLQGLTFAEIAERMEIKTGAARMLWMRAIAKFKVLCDVSLAEAVK